MMVFEMYVYICNNILRFLHHCDILELVQTTCNVRPCKGLEPVGFQFSDWLIILNPAFPLVDSGISYIFRPS